MTSFCITRLIASLLPLRCTDPLPYSAAPFPAPAVSPQPHREMLQDAPPVPHRPGRGAKTAMALTGAHHEKESAIVVGVRCISFSRSARRDKRYIRDRLPRNCAQRSQMGKTLSQPRKLRNPNFLLRNYYFRTKAGKKSDNKFSRRLAKS